MTKEELKKSEAAQKAENENVSDEELAKVAGGTDLVHKVSNKKLI